MGAELPQAGVARRTAGTDRLFFALRPDAAAIVRIERLIGRLRQDPGLTGKPLGAERFHVTLRVLGDFPFLPQQVIDAACAAAQPLTVMPAFRVGFERVGSIARRPRNMPLVLLGEAATVSLKAFQASLDHAMDRAGVPGVGYPHYTPHLTLLYTDRYLAPCPVEPIGWTAHDFVLVRSLIGRGRHEVLARWALRA
ncbi:2'-5' RNA ligase family protein [Variovorax defluvii]|uniref:2'-5' RNA ligase family protein n=1 Tax=Variovorax defluvii TaxID=913761 RepID=A0ABP8HU25_9BURK